MVAAQLPVDTVQPTGQYQLQHLLPLKFRGLTVVFDNKGGILQDHFDS